MHQSGGDQVGRASGHGLIVLDVAGLADVVTAKRVAGRVGVAENSTLDFGLLAIGGIVHLGRDAAEDAQAEGVGRGVDLAGGIHRQHAAGVDDFGVVDVERVRGCRGCQ